MSDTIKQACINCINLKHTGIGEIYRCKTDKADVHPLLRTMSIGEACGRHCKNQWRYNPIDAELMEKYPRLRIGYTI